VSLAAATLALALSVAPGLAAAATDPGPDGPVDLTRYGRLHRMVATSSSAYLFSSPDFSELAPGDMANPFPVDNAEAFSTPSGADLDDDGDIDFVVGEELGTFYYLENTGNATTPAFTQQSGASNPFDGLSTGDKTAPAFVDIDNDGDYDVITGRDDGQFRFIRNDGTVSVPDLAITANGDNPLDGVDAGTRTAPAFGDLDDDGDFDMLVGLLDGTFGYYQNDGTASAANFTEITGASNPMDGVDVGDHAKPALVDLDNDGDLDLVVGEETGVFFYYENTGDATTPTFAEVTGASNPFDGFSAEEKSAPAFADLDDASGVDMVSGNTDGDFYYYVNADPLPVELTSFEASANGGEVTLRWATASETNNAGFEIQQRIGRRYEVVGWVEGAGTTTEARAYSFTVARTVPGRQAFRLRQVDFDGAFTFSAAREVSVAIAGAYHMSEVFPNPFNPQASFTLTVAQTQNVTVGVYDMQGRMMSLLHSGVLEGEQPYSFQLNGSDWASGKYLVRAVGDRFESSRIVTLLK
jgi:hypothetical protein